MGRNTVDGSHSNTGDRDTGGLGTTSEECRLVSQSTVSPSTVSPSTVSPSNEASQRFDAVLFDWMLTLAHYPTREDHLRLALTSLDRPVASGEVDEMVQAIKRAELLPEVGRLMDVVDTSARAHVRGEKRLFSEAGFDEQLVDALYRVLGTPGFHPPYPDALGTLQAVKAAGLSIGVVSDIHVDLRDHADMFGFAHLIDAWSLSWEQGIQKPNLQMFRTALDQLDVDPERAIMVGDRGVVDGAAAELGVTCLILPAVDRTLVPLPNRQLSLVLDLVGLS